MKTPKPGEFFWLNRVLYQARKRKDGCKGCALYDISMCPNVVDSRNGVRELQCQQNNIILTKV